MRLSIFTTILASIPLAIAQNTIYTTTLPWAEGNTVVISESINALGATAAIVTISTIAQTGTALTTAATTATTINPLLVTASSSSTTINPLVATTTTSKKKTTTTQYQGPVADTTTACTGDLCATSTSYYWFTSNGVVYSTYFSPTYTSVTSVTNAPAGTILDFSSYASSNGAAITAAAASQAAAASVSGSGGHREVSSGLGMGWIAVLGGIVGGGMLLI